MSCSKGIVIFGLRHHTSALLIDGGDSVLGRDAEFIGTVANKLAILGVQLCQVVRLFESQELVNLPEVGHGCQKWTRKTGQWVEVHLVHNIAYDPEDKADADCWQSLARAWEKLFDEGNHRERQLWSTQ